MKRTVVLALLISTLLVVAPFIPVAQATAFTWDGVQFVSGTYNGNYIKYPYANREYYDISPYSEWSRRGIKTLHVQFDYAKSLALGVSLPAIGAAMGVFVGVMINPAVGTLTGIVLASALTWEVYVYFLDEEGCLWWWLSLAFLD